MDELDNLPELLDDISAQDVDNYTVYFCVNQPDDWWHSEEKAGICERNLSSIEYILKHADFAVKVIDRSSRGKGWTGKKLGVGWARKVAMDAVLEEAENDDIIITLDGDTTFKPAYFRSVRENFVKHPEAVGLSVPYLHLLTGSEAEDRAILRYEIYMRNYAINLWRINNPYHFTALGSAMAIPVSSYMAIGGMTPKKSGEDFYFLQKLVKYGKLLTWNEEKVYPAARFSNRVFFGTGPAMIKGDRGDWESYPVYHYSLFDEVRSTYDYFDKLYSKDISTPLGDFLEKEQGQKDIWSPLRKNSKTAAQFRKACTDKIDGLRILQFLKHNQETRRYGDGESFLHFIKVLYPEYLESFDFLKDGFTFEELTVEQLDIIRNSLAMIEEVYQKEHHG